MREKNVKRGRSRSVSTSPGLAPRSKKPVAASVVVEPQQVADRLSELGLTEEILRNAIIAGDLARAACTANDPPLFRGVTFWGRTTRALRELLAPAGWEKDDTAGFATVRNKQLGVAIVVVSGDMGTGSSDATVTPKSKYRKGTITIAAVDNNAAQLDLFDMVNEAPAPPTPDENGMLTWVLLVYRAPGSKEIRSELSLPSSVSDDGKMSDWAERIPLAPIPYGQGTSTPPPLAGEELDVPVARKPPEEK